MVNKAARRQIPGPDQESAWDYPRPPITEDFAGRVRVVFNNTVVAESQGSKRVLETYHPPVYYIPLTDIRGEFIVEADAGTVCEWKGPATYYTISVHYEKAERAAWRYPNPTPEFASIKDSLAFYPAAMDACFVNDEPVVPQSGDFYGGWITRNIVGPFKGSPGTMDW
ncbi:MAG: DUF427 domain-containing protein [Candidatus Latescibacteria bacterium]|nr:DUF427 domain-containing protein [Candidatus Latescibacterota bacterium]